MLDPNGDHWPHADYVTANAKAFLSVVKQSRGCFLFVDEAGETCSNFDKEMHFLPRRGRHLGHSAIFMSQMYHDLAKVIRSNVEAIYLFRTGLKDCLLAAEEWACPEMEQAFNFKQGQYIYKERYGDAQIRQLF